MLKINDVPNILEKVPGHISIKVIADIEKRTLDWIASGGSESDPYVQQKIQYAKQVAAAYERRESNG